MCDPVIDPEFAEYIIPLSADEKSILAAKLNTEGMREPILTWRNLIIDGHHRHEICLAESLPFECREMKFASRDDVKEWMILNQLGRRNVSPAARASLVLKLEELVSEKSLKREKGGVPVPTSERGRTDKVLADKAKVGTATIQNMRKAEASPVKELARMAIAGKVTPNAAAKVAAKPVARQQKAVDEGPEAVKELAAEKESPADPFAHYPEKTREAFTANAEFTKALNTLRSLVGHINAIAGDEKPDSECMAGGFWLRKERQTALTDCRNLKQLLNFSRPYAVCPYCVAKDAKCQPCKGTGWVHKSAYQTAPSEYKARVKGMVIE